MECDKKDLDIVYGKGVPGSIVVWHLASPAKHDLYFAGDLLRGGRAGETETVTNLRFKIIVFIN